MKRSGVSDQGAHRAGIRDQGSGVRRQFGQWRQTPVYWLRDRAGDMVWNALIIVTVLLPLSGLAIDAPRYFALRSRLQIATDAAAEAAARQVDIRHYSGTGETRLDAATYAGEAAWAFATAVATLRERGYTANFDSLAVDEALDAVTATASGTIRLFYNVSPPVTVRVSATSLYRLTQK